MLEKKNTFIRLKKKYLNSLSKSPQKEIIYNFETQTTQDYTEYNKLVDKYNTLLSEYNTLLGSCQNLALEYQEFKKNDELAKALLELGFKTLLG